MMTLVEEGALSLTDVARGCAEQPAKHFGLYPRKGAVVVGADADLIVADPNRPELIENASQRSRARYTTMRGRKVSTGIDSVYLRGKLLVQNGRTVAPPRGQFVAP
jgi:dihydroorotase-like cyclic amidohydrolase